MVVIGVCACLLLLWCKLDLVQFHRATYLSGEEAVVESLTLSVHLDTDAGVREPSFWFRFRLIEEGPYSLVARFRDYGKEWTHVRVVSVSLACADGSQRKELSAFPQEEDGALSPSSWSNDYNAAVVGVTAASGDGTGGLPINLYDIVLPDCGEIVAVLEFDLVSEETTKRLSKEVKLFLDDEISYMSHTLAALLG